MRAKCFFVGLMMSLFCALSASVCCAEDLQFHVSLNTTPLTVAGSPPAPFSLDFQLNDGSGTNDANNTATLFNFAFGGGGPSGAPTLIGGVNPLSDLLGQVIITDSNFLNEFAQGFTPGNALDFDVHLTTNVDAGPTPDQFSFAILDSGGNEIPTQGLAALGSDVFLSVDLNSPNPPVQTFASDPSRPPVAGGAPINMSAPVVQVIPEPTTLMLLVVGFAGLVAVHWRRKK